MNIPANQVASRKRLGHIGRRPVFGISCIGGFHLVVAPKDGGFETLAASSHPGVALFAAKKHSPELVIDALAKSEELDYRHVDPDLLAESAAWTAQLNAHRR